ncbi:MAG TPA: flagellar hook-basal body complex protein FliE [Planctomycetota bacterium]|nr:flagellar hook-basal body complex protein FliE [Planctomycetota bacterium]
MTKIDTNNLLGQMQGLSGRVQETRLPDDGKRRALSIDDREEPSFGDIISDSISSVAEKQNAVRTELEKFATGKSEGVHDVMLAMGKSEVAFSLMLEVRNRLVEAWREITRIQV